MAQQYSAAATLRLSVEGGAAAKKELQEVGAAAVQAGDQVEAANKKTGGFSLASTIKQRRSDINAAGGIAPGKSSSNDVSALRQSLTGQRGGNGDNSRFENVDTGFSAVQILAGSLGQQDLGEKAGLVADAANFIDTLPQLKQGFADLSQLALSSGGAIGKLAGFGSAALAPLGATAASLGAIVAVAAPFAAALAVGVVAIKAYQNATEAGSKSLEKASTELKAYFGAVESGTRESLEKEVEGLKLKKKLADEELKLRKGAIDTAFQSEQKGFGGDAAARLKFALAGLDGNFRSNQERVDELKKSSTDLDSQIAALSRAMDSGQVAANDLKKKQEELNAASKQYNQERLQNEITIGQAIKDGSIDSVKGRLEAIDTEKKVLEREIAGRKTSLDHLAAAGQDTTAANKELAELQKRLDSLTNEAGRYTPEVLKQIQAQHDLNEAAAEAQKRFEGARDALKGVTKEIADTENARAKTLKRRDEDDQIAAARDITSKDYQARIKAAQEADQLKQHNDRLGAIRKGADQRIEELTKAAIQKDNDDRTNYAKTRASLDKSYMGESLKALKDYQSAEEQADSQHKTARLRILEDMYASLYDAAANNDVAAFLQNKKAGEQNLTRLDQDSSTEAEARQKAYLEQSQERDQKYADDQQALEENYAEQKAIRDNGLAEQIAQIEAQEAEQIKVEQAQWDNRITRAQQLQDEYAAIQEQWKKEDQDRARRLDQEDYDERIKALKDNQTEQLRILGESYGGQIEIIRTFAEQAKAALEGNLGAGANVGNIGGSILNDLAGALGIQLYAEGGVATKPTLGILGERPGWGDLVIPFPQSEGPRGGLARAGANVTVDLRGAMLTGGATQADLDKLHATALNAVASAWESMASELGVG